MATPAFSSVVRPISIRARPARCPRTEDTPHNQVEVYAKFKQLLDDARFDCRFGSRTRKERGRQTCGELLTLDEIEQRPVECGRVAATQPNLQMFKEDVFESFLVSALVEQELAEGQPARQRRLAGRRVAQPGREGTRHARRPYPASGVLGRDWQRGGRAYGDEACRGD